MLTENNHYKNLWDGKESFSLERKNYKVSFGKAQNFLSFRESVTKTAFNIIKTYDKVNLFLSGGFDSNAMFLGFILSEQKHNIKVKIIQFNKNINLFDYKIALALCKIYNVEYEIIYIDIEKFLSTYHVFYASKLLCNDPQVTLFFMLLNSFKYKNTINVFGLGDFHFKHDKRRNKFFLYEFEYTGRFNISLNNYIPFYRYDPVIIKSWLLDPIILDFVNGASFTDNWNSYKHCFYLKHFPELSYRKKYNGFEPIQNLLDFTIRYSNSAKVFDKLNINNKYFWSDYVEMVS